MVRSASGGRPFQKRCCKSDLFVQLFLIGDILIYSVGLYCHRKPVVSVGTPGALYPSNLAGSKPTNAPGNPDTWNFFCATQRVSIAGFEVKPPCHLSCRENDFGLHLFFPWKKVGVDADFQPNIRFPAVKNA